MSVHHVFPDCIVTDVCTMNRWPDKIYKVRPGVYYVISSCAFLDLLALSTRDGTYGSYRHPVAVVDDFGDLVGVPA